MTRGTHRPSPEHTSTETESLLSSTLTPAWPERAAWGTAGSLRAWQTAAISDYLERSPRDYLAVATPGAGKTTFALSLAADLLGRRVVDRIVVVAPTEHLKNQWASAAARAGIPIDPTYSAGAGKVSPDFVGVALTYAGVAVNPLAMRIRTERFKTLVILDEIHHAGDAMSWGEGVREAFEPATRRLGLTGTPFRSDVNPIPFVTYAPDADNIKRSMADYTYGYERALADHVVRPVLFLAYSGEMTWRTRAGDEIAARLGGPATKDLTNQALRTALDPQGSWIPAVLSAADKRLEEVRRGVPDAGGLVIATDQESARAYAALLKKITGQNPTLVLSDEKTSSRRIEKFAAGEDRWMVAVRMVSEGVDVPRLAVGVYATTTSTPLFFAQAVGRFVRARSRGESASIFLPSVPVLLEHASALELERDHALGRPIRDEDDIFAAERDLLEAAEASADEPGTEEQLSFEALGSQASFDHVLYDGAQYGHEGEVQVGSEEEMDFLGIPGLLEPDQMRALLHQRQSERARNPRAKVAEKGADQHAQADPAPTHQQLSALRRELNDLVASWHHRTGEPHGVTHAALRKKCGGPPSATASASQLHARIDLLRSWAQRSSRS